MTNEQLAKILLHISQILDIQGENPFKIRAYVRAADTIAGLTYPLSSLGDRDKIVELPGIGTGIAKKIVEILETGKLEYYEKLRASEYAPLTELLQVPGMGPKHARLVHDALGVTSVRDLKRAAQQGKLRGLKGLGKKAEEKVLQGIVQAEKFKERLPLSAGYPLALAVMQELRECRAVERISLAGSLRRMRDTVGDLDLLAASERPEEVMEWFVGLGRAAVVLARGSTKSSIVTQQGLQVDLRVVRPESFGAAAHHFTGSKAHNIRMRSLGLEKGLRINEYGVFRGDVKIAGATEEEVFQSVGLPYIPPEMREDQGEIEAALEGRLPRLVAIQDMMGDLHVHSDWTDGRDSIETMAAVAREKGYSYLAICDHSPAVGITGGLDPRRLLEQGEEIRRLNRRGGSFRVLAGIEVDIRSDGRLDLADDVLSQLDLVVAAVHSGFGQSRDKMTDRILCAVENPHVHILAHPTGRLVGKREPYPVDMDRIMEACKATGTILECNACPERLDLSDIHCRKARQAGVRVAISTDAHSAAHLEWMSFGVATARRGWLEPKDVVNTLPLKQLLKTLGR